MNCFDILFSSNCLIPGHRQCFVRLSGIVTRCPLELRLRSCPDDDVAWKGRIRYRADEQESNSSDEEEVENGVDVVFEDPSEIEHRVRQGIVVPNTRENTGGRQYDYLHTIAIHH